MKSLLLLVLISISNAVSAQKEVALDFNIKKKSIRFPAAIKVLDKTDYYRFLLPASLTFHKAPGEALKIFEPYELSVPNLKAKMREEQAVYFFEIIAPGVKDFVPNANRFVNYDYNNQRGYCKDVNYNFPCSLIVKMFDGKEMKVLRKIEITGNDEILTTTYDMGFASGSGLFPTEQALNSSFSFNQATAYKTIERGAYRAAYYKFTDMLGHLFSEMNIGKTIISIAIIKTKKREFEFTDIDTVGARFDRAIDLFYSGDTTLAKSQIAVIAKDYEKLLISTELRIDANVKDLAKYNLSYCNVFLGNLAKADELRIGLNKKIFPSGYGPSNALKEFIEIYKFRKKAENLPQ